MTTERRQNFPRFPRWLAFGFLALLVGGFLVNLDYMWEYEDSGTTTGTRAMTLRQLSQGIARQEFHLEASASACVLGSSAEARSRHRDLADALRKSIARLAGSPGAPPDTASLTGEFDALRSTEQRAMDLAAAGNVREAAALLADTGHTDRRWKFQASLAGIADPLEEDFSTRVNEEARRDRVVLGVLALLFAATLAWWFLAMRTMARWRSIVEGMLVEREAIDRELEALNHDLESRVRERTAQLEQSLQSQQEALAAVETSRASMLAVLNNLPDGAWMKDLEGRYVVVNEPFGRTVGRPVGEVRGLRDQDLWPSALAEAILQEDRIVIESRQRAVFRMKQVGVSGNQEWVEVIKSPVLSHDGEILYTVGVARDITDRQRAEVTQSALFKIGMAANETSDLPTFFGRVHAAVGEIMDVRNFFIALYDEVLDEVSFPYHVDQFDPPPAPRRGGNGLTERVIRTREPLLYSLHPTDPHAAPLGVDAHGKTALDWLGVPLLHGSSVLGVIVVQSYAESLRYREREKDLLLFVSNQLAGAIFKKRQEECLRLSEERYALAARGANDGLWDWDIVTGRVYYSERWLAILGISSGVAVDTSIEGWLSRVAKADAERVRASLQAHLEGRTEQFQEEHRLRTITGEMRWVLVRGVAVRDRGHRAIRMAGSLTDISTRKAAEERIQHDALFDPLTSLANRALFFDRLRVAVNRAKRSHAHAYAVLFLDLDRFKVINDTYGHQVGDRLLVRFAERLKGVVRTVDTVARLGGDEFTVLLDGVSDMGEAEQVACRIIQSAAIPFHLDNLELLSPTSIGIAQGTSDYVDPADVLRDADIALYAAKAQGRSRYVIFEPHMRDQAAGFLRLENELRRAMEAREFLLEFQPIVSLTTMEIAGFEALIRWNHPRRGLVLPREFVPVAEETGIMILLDQWALSEAVRWIAVWGGKALGKIYVNVNLTAHHVEDPALVSRIDALTSEVAISPGQLRLEITETALMRQPHIVEKTFAELQARGIRIALDDFGTGYSSLSHVHRFPIDTIKIDRSFTSRVVDSAKEQAIVRGIVRLASDLGLSVVAEGVEDSGQEQTLRDMGCAFAQGYHFSRPVGGLLVPGLLAAPPWLSSPTLVKHLS